MQDNSSTIDGIGAALGANNGLGDAIRATGVFTATCRDKDGNVLWEEQFHNLLTTVGKNLLLDEGLAGSAYTATEYMGLISSVSYSALAAADTMTSHAGWLEAGSTNAPTYSGSRPTCAWSAAASGTKALSAGLTFTFTGSGTVEGAFLVGGASASATVGNTGGTLYAEAALGTAQPVISGNTLTLTYQSTLT